MQAPAEAIGGDSRPCSLLSEQAPPIIAWNGAGRRDSECAGRSAMPTPPFLLSLAQIRRLSPHFPLSRGKPRVDDPRVLCGIIYIIRHSAKRMIVMHLVVLGQAESCSGIHMGQ